MAASSIPDILADTGFDISAHKKVAEQAAILSNPNDENCPWKYNCWFGFISAWNGVTVRLRSAADYNNEFALLLSEGAELSIENLYVQERTLFGCIVSALSAVECFYISVYCLASAIDSQAFPLKESKHLLQSPKSVAEKFDAWRPSDHFSAMLFSVVKSTTLRDLQDFRNALAHRGILPRKHFLSTTKAIPSALPSNPKSLAENFAFNVEIDVNIVSQYSSWALTTVSQLTGELLAFLLRPDPKIQ